MFYRALRDMISKWEMFNALRINVLQYVIVALLFCSLLSLRLSVEANGFEGLFLNTHIWPVDGYGHFFLSLKG